MVRTIVDELFILDCSDLSFIYIIAPFIEGRSLNYIEKLKTAVQFLSNRIRQPYFRPQEDHPDRKLFHKMIQRSSPLGLMPVIEALYTLYMRTNEFDKFSLPLDIISLVTGFLDIEEEAIIYLAKAIRDHKRVL
jgi:hypothetical protein